MRTIKFRGRSGNLWAYGNLYIVEHEEYGDSAYIIGAGLTTIVDISTIGQFTGLHDMNGKEIYEGDIVKYPLDERNDVAYIGFLAAAASFRIIAEHTDFGIGNRGEFPEFALEVIGNIYDNSELLETRVTSLEMFKRRYKS